MAAPSAPMTLYADSLRYINGICESYVGENVVAVARVVGPFLTSMLTLYVALWGFATFRGLIKEPFNEFIGRIAKVTAILGIGYNMANYNVLIVNTFLHGPDEFIAGMARSSGANGVITGLDAVLANGFTLTGQFWTKAGVLHGDFGMYFVALGVAAATIIVTAYAFFLLALSKVMLTAIICLGPFVMIGLLFEATAGFFNSWLRQMANYFMVPVLVVMVNLLVMTLFSRAATGAMAIKDTTEVAKTFPFFAMALVCFLALASVLSVASGLAGGVSMSSFGMGRFTGGLFKKHGLKAGKQIGRQAARPVTWAGRKTGQAMLNAYRNRKRNTIRPAKSKAAAPRLTYEP